MDFKIKEIKYKYFINFFLVVNKEVKVKFIDFYIL